MTVSSSELTALSGEISQLATGYRVGKIHQNEDGDITILFTNDRKVRLFISTHLKFGRIYLTGTKTPFAATPTPFAQLLRKYLSGKRLEGVENRPNDRMARLRFSAGAYSLFCRFYGGGGFLLTDENGKLLGISNYRHKPPLATGDTFEMPPTGTGVEEKVVFEGSPSRAIEKHYSSLVDGAEFEDGKKRILTSLQRELKKCRNLQKALEADREKFTHFLEYKKWGDLCGTFFNDIKKGSSEITLADPATGEDTRITLAPELSAAQNIDRFYKKYKKGKTGISKIKPMLKKGKEKEGFLESEIKSLKEAGSLEELERFGPTKPVGKKAKKEKSRKPKYPWRTYTSSDGYEIHIGRNDKQNDELVRKSNGNDIWLHTRDFPGSHVIVRTGGKNQPPPETIREAAQYALRFSSLAKNKKGVVIYTNIKYIKRPKKAPPGKVLVTREKTIHVRIS